MTTLLDLLLRQRGGGTPLDEQTKRVLRGLTIAELELIRDLRFKEKPESAAMIDAIIAENRSAS